MKEKFYNFKGIIAVFILLFLVCLFFLPLLDFKSIPFSADFTGSDLLELNFAFKGLLKQSLSQGRIPLWSHLLSCGFPVLAEGQTGIFYPLNLIFYSLLPLNAAFNLLVFLNFFLAGFFVYIYARSLKISRLASLFASISFCFSGFFIFRLKHINLINAAIWLPLEFFLIEKYFQTETKAKNFLVSKRFFYLVLLAVVFAIQFFAGFPPISYISVISCFLYFALRFLFSQDKKNKGLIKSIFKIIIPWLIAGVLFLGLSAIQFLPTYELSKISNRANWGSYENSTLYKYPFSNLIYFLKPYFFGNPAANTYLGDIRNLGVFWENNVYLGILPLFLAVSAIFFLIRKNKLVRIFLILFLISLVFSIGIYYGPFKFLFWIIPGLKVFRFPQRFLLLTLFSLVVLAGFGFDWFWQKARSYIQGRNIKLSDFILRVLPGLFILILVLDLFYYGIDYNNAISFDKYLEKPESVKFLEQAALEKEFFRIYSFGWMASWRQVYKVSHGWAGSLETYLDNRELLQPNYNIFFNLASSDDRGWIEGGLVGTSRFNQLQSHFTALIYSGAPQGVFKLSPFYSKLLGIENVKYVLSFFALEGEGFEFLKEIKLEFLPSLRIYKNKYFLPRALDFYQVKNINKPEDFFTFLKGESFDSSKVVILEEAVNYQNKEPQKRADILIEEYNDTEIELAVDFSEQGFLFLGNVYFPGWQAFVDGEPVKIYRANYTFQAIKVESGEHRITFVYESKFYKLGKNITLFTIFIFLLYFNLYLYYNKRRKDI